MLEYNPSLFLKYQNELETTLSTALDRKDVWENILQAEYNFLQSSFHYIKSIDSYHPSNLMIKFIFKENATINKFHDFSEDFLILIAQDF